MQEQEQKQTQETEAAFNVPYIVYESAQTRLERVNKSLIIALIVSIALGFVSNMAWLYAWNQYDYSGEDTQIDVDAKDGVANYIGNDGDINNGTDFGKNKDKAPNVEE